jgi:peptidoglycan-associated lipoprotein
MRPRSLFVVLVIGLGGVACHTAPPAVAPTMASTTPVPARREAPPAPPSRTSPARPAPTPSAPVTEEELFRRLSVAQLNDQHLLADAFFDYDQATLRDDARQALARDAEWLRKWPQVAIRIEGHCDERGTAEYNLTLGERRARIVEHYLIDLGIDPHRIAVTSLGKEAPFCTGSTDACWSQNRRGHFLVTAK